MNKVRLSQIPTHSAQQACTGLYAVRQHRRIAALLPELTDELEEIEKASLPGVGGRPSPGTLLYLLRHGGFTEGADSDLTDAELRAAGRHRTSRQLPTYAKRTGKQLIAAAKKRRAERTTSFLLRLNTLAPLE